MERPKVSDKFDALSKHLAKKQTRRGALKLLGATLVGGVASAFVAKDRADAQPVFNGCYFNGTANAELINACFNETLPDRHREHSNFPFFAPRRRPRFNGYGHF